MCDGLGRFWYPLTKYLLHTVLHSGHHDQHHGDHLPCLNFPLGTLVTPLKYHGEIRRRRGDTALRSRECSHKTLDSVSQSI